MFEDQKDLNFSFFFFPYRENWNRTFMRFKTSWQIQKKNVVFRNFLGFGICNNMWTSVELLKAFSSVKLPIHKSMKLHVRAQENPKTFSTANTTYREADNLFHQLLSVPLLSPLLIWATKWTKEFVSRQKAEACQQNSWLQESPKKDICTLLKKKGGKTIAEFSSILLSCYKFIAMNTGTRTMPTSFKGFFSRESSRLEKTFKDHRSLTNKLTCQASSLS